MDIIMDPVLGEARQRDGGATMRSVTPTVESDTAVIGTLRGGEKYTFSAPLKSLTIGAVEDSPLESEVIFDATSGIALATEITVGMRSDWESVEHTLTLDDPVAVGNARTFSAEFYDDDQNWDGYGQWRMRAYVDPATRKWTIRSEFDGTHWEENPETGDWDEVPYTFEGVFAVAKEADVELEFVEWTDFNYDRIPKGNAVREGVFAEIDGGASPPMISIPASVGVIGALPVFDAGKQYILNFRDGLVVGAEVRR